jgi:hypothetical protein
MPDGCLYYKRQDGTVVRIGGGAGGGGAPPPEVILLSSWTGTTGNAQSGTVYVVQDKVIPPEPFDRVAILNYQGYVGAVSGNPEMQLHLGTNLHARAFVLAGGSPLIADVWTIPANTESKFSLSLLANAPSTFVAYADNLTNHGTVLLIPVGSSWSTGTPAAPEPVGWGLALIGADWNMPGGEATVPWSSHQGSAADVEWPNAGTVRLKRAGLYLINVNLALIGASANLDGAYVQALLRDEGGYAHANGLVKAPFVWTTLAMTAMIAAPAGKTLHVVTQSNSGPLVKVSAQGRRSQFQITRVGDAAPGVNMTPLA